MSIIDLRYNEILYSTLKGEKYLDKNSDVFRTQIPRYNITHSFNDGFPAISLKKLAFKSVVTELIWFLRGDNNIKYLNDNNVNIWNKDAYNWYKSVVNEHNKDFYTNSYEDFCKNIGNYNDIRGSIGANYSKQWRDFNNQNIDQIKNLIQGMKENIMSTRLKVEAWNPAQIEETALPPCHTGFQIIGVNNNSFWLDWNQRSVDTFLGLPFNIASYAVLAKILEGMTGYKALGINGALKCVHLYENQLEPSKELLRIDVNKHCNCEIEIDYDFTNKGVECFDELEPSMFRLVDYTSEPSVKVEMIGRNK